MNKALSPFISIIASLVITGILSMKIQIEGSQQQYGKLYGTKSMTLSPVLLIGILALSCLSTSIFKQQNQALAQQYVQTIKYRNLIIDLGNAIKTNAQL